MCNNYVLVGRIKEIKEDKTNKCAIVTLTVPQSFKNANGEHDTNFIDVRMFGSIAESTKEYCKIGDIVGVRGRLQKLENDKELNVIAERVSFLSSKALRKEDEE